MAKRTWGTAGVDDDGQVDAQLRRDATAQMGDGEKEEGEPSARVISQQGPGPRPVFEQGTSHGGEAPIRRVEMVIRTIFRLFPSQTVDGAFLIILSSPEQQDVRVLNVVDDGVYEGPSGSTMRAHGSSLTFEIYRPQWPTTRLYTFFEAMAVRNAVRGVSNILKRPFARALHIGSTPYNYVVSPALGYSPRHERPAPVIPASPGLAILHRARQPPASPYTLVPRVFASQPPPYSPCDPNSPSRPPGRINFYPPPLTDGELQWHLWDAPPAVVDDTLLADTSIAYFPIHTLTIYIPQLADWQWHAWGPLVVRRPDGQHLRIADVLGAIYEYLHAPLTVADIAELRIARRTPDVGGKWARDAGESWSWEAEVMQFMLNRVESAGPEKVGVVPRRVDMLAGKVWFDKLVQALGHGQHAEMSLTFKDG
ncbi:hypothetical protein EV715DRAFT_273925 [Schizophyllum commune]